MVDLVIFHRYRHENAYEHFVPNSVTLGSSGVARSVPTSPYSSVVNAAAVRQTSNTRYDDILQPRPIFKAGRVDEKVSKLPSLVNFT